MTREEFQKDLDIVWEAVNHPLRKRQLAYKRLQDFYADIEKDIVEPAPEVEEKPKVKAVKKVK